MALLIGIQLLATKLVYLLHITINLYYFFWVNASIGSTRTFRRLHWLAYFYLLF